MQSSLKLCFVLCSVLVLSTAVMAEDVWPPPWVEDPTDPQWEGGVTTFQLWEFSEDLQGPVLDDNPFGTAELQWTNATPEVVPGPHEDATGQALPIWTWHIDEPGGGVDILVHNNPEPNWRKVIWVQITSDKAPSPTSPSSNPPGTTSYPVPAVQWPNGTWYTYTARIDIPFNPEFEVIHYDFPASTNISEIVVDTICVPEPASLTLLGLGVAGLLLRRRR